MAAGGFFRKLRVLSLLFLLVLVAGNAWLTKLEVRDWDRPLRVVIYPLNADGSVAASRYIDALDPSVFESVGEFLAREAQRYGLALGEPLRQYLAPPVHSLPPQPPRDRNMLGVVWWSLRLRYWAYRVSKYDGPTAQIRIFVLYHDPQAVARLGHSLGLEKGLIGVVNAYADSSFAARNNVVIAHELLHTLGATDKYDPSDNRPLYPDGYAEPERVPLLPQAVAEIMAGRVPLSETSAVIPDGLGQAVVGEKTAREVNWIE
jgi:hypothetical protein